MTEVEPGRRVYLWADALPGAVPTVEPGDYGQDSFGTWWAKVPAKGFSAGALTDHSVTEHENGTITVTPSILMPIGDGRRWHGYLTEGRWYPLGDCVLERNK